MSGGTATPFKKVITITYKISACKTQKDPAPQREKEKKKKKKKKKKKRRRRKEEEEEEEKKKKKKKKKRRRRRRRRKEEEEEEEEEKKKKKKKCFNGTYGLTLNASPLIPPDTLHNVGHMHSATLSVPRNARKQKTPPPSPLPSTSPPPRSGGGLRSHRLKQGGGQTAPVGSGRLPS